MNKVTLKDLAILLGWRGHSAYFNSKLFGFPEHVGVTPEGEKLYIYEDIIAWDRNRPVDPSTINRTGIILIVNTDNNNTI